MRKAVLSDIKKGDKLLYIPAYLPTCTKNGEKGIVTMLDKTKGRVWLKFKGPQGELTPADCLWICKRH